MSAYKPVELGWAGWYYVLTLERYFGSWECLNLEYATNMAPMYGPTYGHGPIPFMAMAHSAMAHSIHGHGAFHSWPWPYSIYGQGPHSWPRPCRCRTAKLHLAKRRYISGIAQPGRHPRVDFPRIDRIRESKVTGVGGSSGGSLPSIGAIMEHHIYAYI